MLKIDASGDASEPPIVWIEGQGWQVLFEEGECRGPGMASKADRLKDEIGSWLSRMGQWDIYFTGTWSGRRNLKAAEPARTMPPIPEESFATAGVESLPANPESLYHGHFSSEAGNSRLPRVSKLQTDRISRASLDGCVYGTRAYLNWVQGVAKQRIKAFWGVERGPAGGLLHVHGLIGNVGHLKAYCGSHLPPGKWGVPCCLLHGWPWGISRMESYDPCLGAAHYVGKYITKNLAEWEIFGDVGVFQNPLWTPPSRREIAAKARGAGPRKLAQIRAEEDAQGIRRGERFEWWKAS
jgi:hypothetical protein